MTTLLTAGKRNRWDISDVFAKQGITLTKDSVVEEFIHIYWWKNGIMEEKIFQHNFNPQTVSIASLVIYI